MCNWRSCSVTCFDVKVVSCSIFAVMSGSMEAVVREHRVNKRNQYLEAGRTAVHLYTAGCKVVADELRQVAVVLWRVNKRNQGMEAGQTAVYLLAACCKVVAE